MSAETMPSWGYTAKYEYACSLVKMFLEREEKLDRNTEDHVYSSGLLRTLFTTDYSMIINDNVHSSLVKYLMPDPKSGSSFDVLTRLRNLYMDIATALGSEFMAALRLNTINGLIALGGSKSAYIGQGRFKLSPKELNQLYVRFINDFPIVLICMLGCKDYSLNLLQKRRAIPSPDIVHTNP